MASFTCNDCTSPTNTCAVKCDYCMWGSMMSKGDVACGFGTKCFNKATCPYRHDGPPSADRIIDMNPVALKKATRSVKTQVKCQWGTTCRNKASCPYKH